MWESKEHFEQSADRIQNVLSGLAELIGGPPEVYEGNSVYILIEINYLASQLKASHSWGLFE